MASLSKKTSVFQEKSDYFQKFISKDGDEYGLRFGKPKDAKNISRIFKEVYNYDYLTPLVYDLNCLQEELAKKNNFWFVGELLETHEIAGTGLIEKKRYIAHAGKAVVKKKFQGIGVTTNIGAAGILTVIKMPEFNDVLRLDSEVRGTKVRIQKLIQNAKALPFALIPGYLNYGDKRFYEITNNTPFPSQKEEAAFLYSIIFKKLWKLREKKIFMIENEDFVFFYNFVKNHTRQMNQDELILEKQKSNKDYELFGISRNFYEGIVNLYGYLKQKSLKNLLKTYNNWRIILWRIPTTKNGISSMELAIEKGFNIVGYDIGFNNINWTLFDSVILAYYPNRKFTSIEIDCLDLNKPLAKKIKEIFLL
ncbi:MAG: hypothetical protein ACFFDF_21755 [Candidatus Odinarchaeota archaeon]